jgi:ABC-type bacteriocin/lantibiotic exporter with double-glycine peptidase domain
VISGELSSGKSLLINLMSGIYAPTSGHILYNDVSSKNLTQDQIRRGISIHTDDIDVFKGTVLENIQLGNEKITVEKINHIAQK